MKIPIVLIAFLLTYLQVRDSKLDRICHSWRMVGTKTSDGKYIPASTPQDEILNLKKDGSYEQVLYGKMKIGGQWKFAEDSVKLVFAVTSMNGVNMPNMPLEETKPTDSLIKLTTDTLIYASISYSGPNLEYQHDDKYFIRN